MDAFTLVISLTLAVAGLFLCRDYARFLRGTYAVSGRVTSIQQVFHSHMTTHQPEAIKSHVENGYYPVIEYRAPGGAISFTAIDQSASGRFHIGDEINLRISKTRRNESRACKTVVALVAMLALLCVGLSAAAFISGIDLSAIQIYLASLVIAIGLAILALYVREQDERGASQTTQIAGNRSLLCLCEPSAFKNWAFSVKDPVQAYKILGSQFVGASCMCGAFVMLIVALRPISSVVL